MTINRIRTVGLLLILVVTCSCDDGEPPLHARPLTIWDMWVSPELRVAETARACIQVQGGPATVRWTGSPNLTFRKDRAVCRTPICCMDVTRPPGGSPTSKP